MDTESPSYQAKHQQKHQSKPVPKHRSIVFVVAAMFFVPVGAGAQATASVQDEPGFQQTPRVYKQPMKLVSQTARRDLSPDLDFVA
jgi:hypothetical protein